MRKGQAFDTFKLMIAAVIAVAILGILLGILGGISPPGADPASIIKEQLSKAYQFQKSVFVSTTQANFQSGVLYSPESFKQSIGGTGDIQFVCASSLSGVCTGGSTLSITGNFKAVISACFDPTSPGTGWVGVGPSAVTSC